jgi:hypothetical protein
MSQIVYAPSSKQQILQLLEEHITENIVKVCYLRNNRIFIDNTLCGRSVRITTAKPLVSLRAHHCRRCSAASFTVTLKKDI